MPTALFRFDWGLWTTQAPLAARSVHVGVVAVDGVGGDAPLAEDAVGDEPRRRGSGRSGSRFAATSEAASATWTWKPTPEVAPQPRGAFRGSRPRG